MTRVEDRPQQLRRLRLGAALGAVGVTGAAADLFATVFPDEMANVLTVQTEGDCDNLGIETVIQQYADASAWLDILHDAYGAKLVATMTVERLASSLSGYLMTAGVYETRDGAAPAASFGVVGSLPAFDVYGLLLDLGVSDVAMTAWDQLMGNLPDRRVDAVRAVLDPVDRAPEFRLDARFSPSVALPVKLASTLSRLGIDDTVQSWVGQVYDTATSGTNAAVTVQTTVSAEVLKPELRLLFGKVPVDLALGLLREHSSVADLPMRLGALSGAVAPSEDHVHQLVLTLKADAEPTVGVSWTLGRQALSG